MSVTVLSYKTEIDMLTSEIKNWINNSELKQIVMSKCGKRSLNPLLCEFFRELAFRIFQIEFLAFEKF